MIYELDGIKPKISGEVFIAESADVIGNIEINSFNGKDSIQIRLIDIRKS